MHAMLRRQQGEAEIIAIHGAEAESQMRIAFARGRSCSKSINILFLHLVFGKNAWQFCYTHVALTSVILRFSERETDVLATWKIHVDSREFYNLEREQGTSSQATNARLLYQPASDRAGF